MKIKSMVVSGLAGMGLLSALPAAAESTSPHSLTANVGLFSQYVFRGITFSNEDPAIQGGFDYAHDSGWYAGVWATNLEQDENVGNSIEVDFYGGYYHQFTDDFAMDVGLLQFYYPDRKKFNGQRFDTTEAYAAATWKWFTAKYSRTLTNYGGLNTKSADLDGGYGNGSSRGTQYYELNFDYGLPHDFNLHLHVGRLRVKNYSDFNYTDYMVGLSKDFAVFGADGWTVGVNYTNTTAKKSWWPGADGDNRGESHVIGYIMRTF
ncbi:hypothetical protein MPL1_04692 [Methylophaga lonarensis MPL]|uniref:Nucleoside-binding outer membrane protein n=1 Tax=Methylophaga lonarensis MPL TaxID=1286106 RepID=M7PHY7_9GAMM|nr:TorF family putative porin [Methylophaga lonarensis]EMR13510.1 hypothetical protein MPL1_04692 [Methylophaga lonarensis MPL]